MLSDVKLQLIFNELKGKDTNRDFLTFKDFKSAIIHFKLQLMRGLRPNDPDFHDCCRELFMMICSEQIQKDPKDEKG